MKIDKIRTVPISSFTHNANNELTVAGAVSCSYDQNGNTIQETNGNIITQYTYDSSNRLTAVSTLNSQLQTLNSVEYKYDPFGRRISKTINNSASADGLTTYYLYADEGLIGEYDSAGNNIKSYGWIPDTIWGTNPVFMQENGNYYFYHNDHIGTPQKMTDEAGNVVWSATYTAFGEATVDPSSTITNNLRFAGQYFDSETGKHYNWNRYYDPKTGRYISADPIGFSAGDANLYRYVKNNVINETDPKGLLMEYYKKPFRLYETAPKGFKDLTKEEKEEAYKSYLETKKKLDEYAFQRDYARFFENKQYKIPGQIIIDVRVEVKEIPHWVCEVGVHVGCHLLCESTGASPVICIPTCIVAAALACPEKCDGKKE